MQMQLELLLTDKKEKKRRSYLNEDIVYPGNKRNYIANIISYYTFWIVSLT